MYRSTQAPFDAHCRHDDVATALIQGICKMQLAVRIDKRPGESHTALEKNKSVISGLLAGGSPGFRTVLCCFFSHLLYGDFVIGVSRLFVICFLAIPIHLIMQKAIIFSNRAVWPYVTLQCFWRFGCGLFVLCFVLFCLLFWLFVGFFLVLLAL